MPARKKGVAIVKKKLENPRPLNFVRSFIAPHDFAYLVTKVGGPRAKRFVLGLGYGSTVVYSMVGVKAVDLFEKKLPQLLAVLQKHGYDEKGVARHSVDEKLLRSDLLWLLGKI